MCTPQANRSEFFFLCNNVAFKLHQNVVEHLCQDNRLVEQFDFINIRVV